MALSKTFIKAQEKIQIPKSESEVLQYLWKIPNLEFYEPKVSSIRFKPLNETSGSYTARGRILGLPWGGRFDYQLQDKGFMSRSQDLKFGVQVTGGFFVNTLSFNNCMLTHYEHYQVPFFLLPLKPFLAFYLKHSIRRELKTIKQDICKS